MQTNKLPLWLKILIIVSALPVFCLPALLARADGGSQQVLWLIRCYPVAIVLAAWCAWMAYGQRPELTWILIVIMWLTNGAMWMLV